MKYYKLMKISNEKVKEVEKKDIKFDIKPAKIYQNGSAYFGIGEVSRKFLSVIAKAQSKVAGEMEEYWDKVANNWIEKIEKNE